MSFANTKTTTTRAAVSRWRVLGIACLAHLLHDGYTDMLYLLLPFWQRELALSLAEIGILKTLYSGAMAAFQVPAGRLGEKRGERTLLVAGTVLTAFAVLAFHRATAPFALGLLLVLGGIGASVQHPLSSTLVAKTYDGPGLRPAIGTYNFAGDLGKVAIPGLLAVLIAHFGWRAGTEMIGMLGLATATALFAALAPRGAFGAHRKGNAVVSRPPLPERVRRRGFAALSAIGIVDSATRTGLLTFLPFVLTGKGAGAGALGGALSLVFAGGAAGKFACGALATRIGVLRTVVLTELGTAAAIVLLLGLPLPLCLVLMPVLGVALNGTSSVLYGTVPELAPSGREARAFGFFYTVTIGAGALAPTLYGAAGDGLGLAGSMLLVAVVVLFVLPLVALLRPVLDHREELSVTSASENPERPERTASMSESVCVRPMTEADMAAGRSLLDQLGCDLTPEEMRRRYAAVADAAGHAVLVAECEARPVGLIHLYVRPALDKPPEVIVQAVVIDAAYRKRGIGKILMSAAESWASERGYSSVALYSNVSRSGAHSFYRALGYRLVATSHLFRREPEK